MTTTVDGCSRGTLEPNALEMIQKRTWLTDDTTISTLTVDNIPECYVLEDVVREPGVKVPGKTAIPPGRYNVELTFSPKFQRVLPLLWNVELPDGRKIVQGPDGKVMWEGIRIHPGNGSRDTEGCLLPGNLLAPNRVLESVLAFDRLFAKLALAVKSKRPMYITIS